MNNIGFAFLLTILAGLATGIGGLIAFFAKSESKKFLSVSLGFSAGVMIYVSMVEIFKKANISLNSILGEKMGTLITVISFFAGMLFIAIIDKMIPGKNNPHEPVCKMDTMNAEESTACEIKIKEQDNKNLWRTGIFTALAIGIHNFPEGLATFISATQDLSIAIPIVVAIAIHNIPEGMSVSMPIYYATGSKKKALFFSFLSGVAEPLGAIIGFLILIPFMNDMIFGIIFAGIAGIMVFISLDELLPTAREYGEHHLSIYGLVSGMAVMAFSLVLFI